MAPGAPEGLPTAAQLLTAASDGDLVAPFVLLEPRATRATSDRELRAPRTGKYDPRTAHSASRHAHPARPPRARTCPPSHRAPSTVRARTRFTWHRRTPLPRRPRPHARHMPSVHIHHVPSRAACGRGYKLPSPSPNSLQSPTPASPRPGRAASYASHAAVQRTCRLTAAWRCGVAWCSQRRAAQVAAPARWSRGD